ncbi:hypothetical protein [Sulfodiicoccus acidiphilus]|uniref:hypothetical protein n=1 Tax=Sulfodiicoccus acidiphilus TaxID=1670455 RepID=UPI000F83946E|nr:hypothetical protein [Sulfodiicoccus acidiphilus]
MTPRNRDLFMIFYDTSLAKSLAKSLEPKLRKAGIPDDPQLYASKLLFYTTVSIVPTVLMVTLSVVVIDKLYLPTRVPKYLLGSLILVALGILIPPITYFVQQVFLSQRIYEREVGITSETPVFSSLFVIFLRSGLSPGYSSRTCPGYRPSSTSGDSPPTSPRGYGTWEKGWRRQSSRPSTFRRLSYSTISCRPTYSP